VTFHPGAVKDLKDLDKPVQKQISSVIDDLAMGKVPNNQTHTLRHPLAGWSATKASRGHRIIHRPTDEGGLHIGYIGLHEYGKAERRLGVMAGAKGELPEGLHFTFTPGSDSPLKGSIYHTIHAHLPGHDKPIGTMLWDSLGDEDDPHTIPGEVFGLRVEDPYRRRGIANAMWDHAVAQGPSPRPRHSPYQTEDGKPWAAQKQGARPELHSRIFGPTKGGLDPRLFRGGKMRPKVREAILERLGAVVEPLLGPTWKYALDVYLAGSEASEWWGNDDLDVLVGIDYDNAEESPYFQHIVGIDSHGPTDEEITDLLNKAFWDHYNDENWVAPFGGVWHATAYANPAIGTGGIKRIKPYAAYDIQRNDWVVKPPHLDHWSIADFPEGPELLKEAEAYASLIEAIDKMSEPYRTRQGKALWDHLHAERSRAFSDEGEGWSDTGNVIEKALNEWGLWDKLVQMKYGTQKTAMQSGGLDIPQEQHDAYETENYSDAKRKLLDLAKNPVPGVNIWRGEIRQGDPAQSLREHGVGMHWGVNPDNLVHPHTEHEDDRNVVWHATLEHPGEQAVPRSHPMWSGRHRSMDSEAEVRLRPGTTVKVNGYWIKDPSHPDPGYLVPRFPERTGPGWTYHPVGEHATVSHRPRHGLIDYSDVGIPKEGGKNGDLPEGISYEHRPPSRLYPNEHVIIARHPDADHGPYSNWVGHLTWFDDDGQIGHVTVHPDYQRRGVATELHRRAKQVTPGLHHSDDRTSDGKRWINSLGLHLVTAEEDYRLMHRPPNHESGVPLHEAEGGHPEDLIRIYRSVPHGVDHFDTNTWATTNPEYAHLHGRHATDPSKDWPVISAEVPRKHVYTDFNDENEVGYQGPRLESHELEQHDEETDEHTPFEPRETHEDDEKGQLYWRGLQVRLPPEVHHFVHDKSQPKEDRAHALFKHLPSSAQYNGGGQWEDNPVDAEMNVWDEDYGKHSTPETNVVVHGSQNLQHAHGVSWANSEDNPIHPHNDYEHHVFAGDPTERLESKQAAYGGYYGLVA
jgi:GNAT superfamily N-acetyltransferase